MTENENLEQEEALEPVEIDEKDKKILELEDDLNAYKDKFLRLAAEFENYKKTAQNSHSQSLKYANESILQSFLPIIDNLEMALAHGKNSDSPEQKNLILGLEMVLKLFSDTLANFGVRTISSVGEKFDPAKHEAISEQQDSTVEPGKIITEHQKGYFLHERLLRPSRVVVAKA